MHKINIFNQNITKGDTMKHKLTILLVAILLLITGCASRLTPSEKTEEFLNRYIKNDKTIIEELDHYINKQNLSNNQKEKYKKIILDEYATIKYTIKEEKIEDNKSTVQVEIEVKDLFKASSEAEKYLLEHPEEFYNDDKYDKDKFTDYKLSLMEKETEKTKYEIKINLHQKDNNWIIEELSNETLEKIHGIYDYKTDQTQE